MTIYEIAAFVKHNGKLIPVTILKTWSEYGCDMTQVRVEKSGLIKNVPSWMIKD